ncbi:MAG: ABC transporter substrate-binding protein [Pseudomonadota bacterium]
MHLSRYYLINLLILIVSFVSSSASAEENIRLQLKWHHQFQFAGYYAAKELGYYKEAGLNVEIIEAQPGASATEIVLQGEAEYGVGNSGLMLSKNAGASLIVLAVIFQHSPFILLTKQQNSTDSIHDLTNKHLMIEPLADEIVAYLNHEGLPLDKFSVIQRKHRIDDFISGKVDAMSAYTTTEPFALKQLGIKFNAYSPRSVGIDFYGDNLFTTADELKHQPERVREFREASLQGWRYAMEHPAEIIDLILNKYTTRNSREFLEFEAAQMHKLMHPELIDVGYMLKGRWQHIAETYIGLGMLPKNFSLDGFLYEDNPKPDLFWFYMAMLTALILSIVMAITLRFSKLNRQLLRLLHIKSQFSNIGESVNHISHQWKQPLNELGIQLMLIEQTLQKDANAQCNAAEVQKITDKSHDLLEFMANTVDTFGQLLSTSNRHSDFFPNTTIQEILHFVRDSFALHKISIDYDARGDIELNGSSSELAHVILSILNNARDLLMEREIVEPHIHIHSYAISGIFYIDISDNAGGISVKPLKNIFRLGFSDKQADDSGVGLYIAKKIIEGGFGGTIQAENIDSGARFKIAIPCSA